MGHSLKPEGLESTGETVSSGFHKAAAVACWRAVVDTSGVQEKVLASECGMTPGYFSKVSSGAQGDLLDLVYRLPAHRMALRAEFFARLAESEQVDPFGVAVEQLAVAAMRVLRLQHGRAPMAKAALGSSSRKARIA